VIGDPLLPVKRPRRIIQPNLDVVVDLLLPVLGTGRTRSEPEFVWGGKDLVELPEGIGVIEPLDDDPWSVMKLVILEQCRRVAEGVGAARKEECGGPNRIFHDSSVDTGKKFDEGLVRKSDFDDPERMRTPDIRILGVPMGIGGGKPGTAMGPWKVREMAIVERLCSTLEDAVIEDAGDVLAEEIEGISRLEQTARWCEALKVRTMALAGQGITPLVIGGDHTLAAGSLAGVASAHHARGDMIPGVLWIDAHVDMNTHETSPSGNPHGMSAAALLGLHVDHLDDVVGAAGRIDPTRVAFLGARDIDPGEQRHIEELDLAVFSSEDIHENGVERMVRDALRIVSPDGEPFMVSFDVDVIDPRFAPGVDTAVPGGLTPRQIEETMKLVGGHGSMVAIDAVELNPETDVDEQTSELMLRSLETLVRAAGAEASDRR